MLEIVSMFFTDVHHLEYENTMVEGIKFIYVPGTKDIQKVMYEEDEQAFEIDPQIIMEFHTGCFNIFNFVNNLLDGERFFEQLHESMKGAFGKYLELEQISGRKMTVQKFLEDNSLKKEYLLWKNKTAGFALPLYSMDMMYNIIKRQYQDNRLIPENVEAFDWLLYVKEVYKGIEKQLKQEDEFYFSNLDGKLQEDDFRFYNAFKTCPFIAWLDKLKKNSFIDNKFKSICARMILTLVQIQ